MARYIKLILWVLIIAAIVTGAIIFFNRQSTEPEYKTEDARIKSISNMVDLCTSDIHEELTIKDSVNGKWIVARQTIEGHIRFNLDSLKTETKGDTLIVFLPRERVDILENASPEAYAVLDYWDSSNPVFQRTLTAREENIIKNRWQSKARKRIYNRGYVRDARKNAIEILSQFLNGMRGPDDSLGPVIIIDPDPNPKYSE